MRRPLLALLFLAIVLTTPAANAGIPVIDRTAVANLIQQVAYWQQQLTGMASQLSQLQQTHAAMTGGRGMQNLVPMTPQQRNYLPSSYAELMSTVNGNSVTYSGLSTQIQTAIVANSVLTDAQIGGLNPEMRLLVDDGRRSAAMAQAVARAAYQNTSQRFAALQQLIAMVGAAADLKAIEDLQGRVGAEQVMLTNEQTKLQLLYQMMQADQQARQQRARERSILDIGSVETLQAVPY
jgi:Skp family chaperone for outer membrane proteins